MIERPDFLNEKKLVNEKFAIFVDKLINFSTRNNCSYLEPLNLEIQIA